jgi:hypothetical protein
MMANFNASVQDAHSFANQELYRTYETMRSWAPTPNSEKHLVSLRSNVLRDRQKLREAFKVESDPERKRLYAQRIRELNDLLDDGDVSSVATSPRARAVR